MKSKLLEDFNKQAVEVSQYFMFLKQLEKQTNIITNHRLYVGDANQAQDSNQYQEIYFNTEIEKTLKANGFLLLYNLVEGSMRRSIEYIFDHFDHHKISFDVLREEVKIIVLKNLKKRSPEKIIKIINQISIDVVISTLDRDDIFAGNIDAKKIKEVAKTYGFSSQTSNQRTRDGDDLRAIKDHRKDLTHGWKSFNEIGRDKTAQELFQIKNRVIIYLKQILINVEHYIDNEHYLNP
ncbi:MAG: MAE_28990/MAE_18760 family HEPN-like nuclease [Lyngbya sp.]|nr:MAE_28990/MAE_18760 family HEPN-like nuclease [Lyngbya sp.]